MTDLLTESEGNDATIDVASSGEPTKKRRGRPPGSKNRPREERDGSLAIGLENAIIGIFELMAFVSGWFGYEKTDDLTPEEAKQGAKAFTPIAAKFPWFITAAMWIGAPVWLLMTMRRKFTRKVANNESTANGADSGNRGSGASNVAGIDGQEIRANG